MQLAQFLSPNQVCMDLSATSRDEAIHEMLEQLVEANQLQSGEVEPVLRAIVQRETLGTTAIGRQVAVPHARLDHLDETVIGVGLSEEGVEFHALDGQPVRAVFLVLGSPENSEEYIEVMKSISEMIQTEDFRRFLWRTTDGEDVVELMDEMAE
jgi:PTS system nitrogen regulatory IIA component